MDEVRIRPEIQTLIERGNVTADEIMELRCNSWEWEILIPAMNDQAFMGRVANVLHNCVKSGARPFVTYDESLKGLLVPELLKRFRALLAVAGKTVSSAPAEKQICGSLGPNDQPCDHEPGHPPPHGVGRPSVPQELWLVRIWPDWKVLDTFPTEKTAREYRDGSAYRIDGPYRLDAGDTRIRGDK